uniref:Uncharacterized protein n=2 Tax=Cercopithecinae TaxID=9528 RepID=A0A2K5KJD0_CERAT
MVAPAARVLLRAVRAALASTVPDLLCLPAQGSPRGLASGRLPLAALDSSFGFVLSKHWGDDCYPTNCLWQDLKPPRHLGNGQELRLAPPAVFPQVHGNQLQTAVLGLRMAPPEPAG